MPVASVLKVFDDALFNILASFDRAVNYNQAEIFRINSSDSELSWESKYRLLEERLTNNPEVNVFREEANKWLINCKLEFSRFNTHTNFKIHSATDKLRAPRR